MSRRYRFDDFWFPPTTPKEVKGGIKAQSKRGSFADQWWGKRWVETLESFRIGARLSRGRSYARRGQVATLNTQKGSVTADVQGSRSDAYRVTIKFKSYRQAQWQKIIDKLSEQPIFAAQLLGNEMPEEIESVFEAVGLPLFPEKRDDLKTECSCPDPSNPCKHIAAVFYLMAEAFDSDPFLLFRLRGMERETFLEKLRGTGASEDASAEEEPPEPEPLPLEHESFWGSYRGGNKTLQTFTPHMHAALPKRLGQIPLWRSERNFLDEMTLIYKQASEETRNAWISTMEE